MSNPNETLVLLGDWRHSIHSSIPFISGSIIPDTFHGFNYSVLPFIENPQVVTYERLLNFCPLVAVSQSTLSTVKGSLRLFVPKDKP